MTLLKSIKPPLSGNSLKIIGALFMVCDHVGMLLFPDVVILRILGRIALPIFAFLIAEGCRYTKNKLRYFLTVFLCGVVCQLVYYFYGNSLEMCIFITFSLAIINVYALEFAKKCIFSDASIFRERISIILLGLTLAFTYYLNTVLDIDYGFFGCILPVFAALPHSPKNASVRFFDSIDKLPFSVLTTAVGLVLLGLERGGIQMFGLLALPFLLLYSGKRGKWNMKYFFYVFYPAHLVLIEFIGVLLNYIR